MSLESSNSEECCPVFEPKNWDEKVFEWQNKNFIKDKVFSMFYIPMNFGAAMKRIDEKVSKAGAISKDGLCLTHFTSKWNLELFYAVDKIIPDAENTSLSGKFFSKVYEGSYKEIDGWINQFISISKSKGFEIGKIYLWYTTCPKCVKKHGKNYVVLFNQMK